MHSKPQNMSLLTCGLLIASFLITFAIFVEKLELHRLLGFDMRVIRAVQARIDNRNTRIMKFFTFLGSPIVVSFFVALTVILQYRTGKQREAAGMLIANAAGAGFNETLKLVFRRRRPDIHRLASAQGYSFPSGHSMGSVMFYGTICYFLFRRVKSTILRIFMCLASGWMVLITGISRIYLGVHYPSDVVSGYAAAGASLCGTITVFNAIFSRGFRRRS